MWDLPTSGIRPVSPALAGNFLTIGPAGKSYYKIPISGSQAFFLQSRKITSLYIVTYRTHTHMIMHTRVHTHPRTHTQKLTMPTLLTLIQVTYMMSPMFSFIKKRCRFDVFIQLSKLISIIDCLYSFLESLMEQNKGAGW